MSTYIDGFVFPIKREHIDTYRAIAEQVAEVWRDHDALSCREFICDDMTLEGTRSFHDAIHTNTDEVVVFGWVEFPSKEVRDKANAAVPNDPRMHDLVAPLVHPNSTIFDANRMVYGGFRQLLRDDSHS